MYLPATFKLKYLIKCAVYSTLKWKSTTFYCHHTGGGFFFFAFSSIHQLSPDRVNKGSHLMVEPGILLPLPQSETGFSTFYIGLPFTRTLVHLL